MMHSKLAPSSAHRWINCPGSVALESEFSDNANEYAAEGTLAHKLAELKLKRLTGLSVPEYEFEAIKKDSLYDNDMDNFTNDYVEYVKSIKENGQVFIEAKVKMKSVSPEIYGTADCIIASGDHLQVVDFKYGRNVRVEVKENAQLRLYALGANELLSPLYDFKTVTTHIVQPRMDNIESETISMDTLLSWATQVSARAKEALTDNAPTQVGPWCRFCKARCACREYASSVKEITTNLPNPKKLSKEEIAGLLTSLEGIGRYYKDLENYALSLTLRGQPIPGYKAVEGRSTRTWKDEENAFRAARQLGLSDSELYTKKPISLAKLEKKMGKKTFEKLLGEYVVKPKGKPTLVKESDKREAIDMVKYDFKDLDYDEIGGE